MNKNTLFDDIRQAHSQRAEASKRQKRKLAVKIGEALYALLQQGVDWPEIQATLELDADTLSTFQTFFAAEKRRVDVWQGGFVIGFILLICLEVWGINYQLVITPLLVIPLLASVILIIYELRKKR